MSFYPTCPYPCQYCMCMLAFPDLCSLLSLSLMSACLVLSLREGTLINKKETSKGQTFLRAKVLWKDVIVILCLLILRAVSISLVQGINGSHTTKGRKHLELCHLIVSFFQRYRGILWILFYLSLNPPRCLLKWEMTSKRPHSIPSAVICFYVWDKCVCWALIQHSANDLMRL